MNRRTVLNIILLLLFSTSPVTISYSKDKAEEWMQKGITATDYHEKIRCFEKAVEFNPNYFEAYFNLGCTYRDIGELNKAEKAYNRALRVSPDNVENKIKLQIIYELGNTYSKLGKYKYAKEAYLYAINIANDVEIKGVIFYELGKLYILGEEFEQAITTLNKGIKLNPQNLASFKTAIDQAQRLQQLHVNYKEGITHFQQGNYNNAVASFAKIVEIDPNFKEAADKLYQSQVRLARINEKKAIATDNSLAVTNNNSPPENAIQNVKIEEFYRRGITALKNDNWRTAIYNFSKVKKINPDYKDINSRLMESRLGRESAKELEEVAKFYNHAVSKFDDGEWLKAIIDFEKAKMLYPGYKDIELKIAEAKRRLKREDSTTETGDSISFSQTNGVVSEENKSWSIVGIIFSLLFIPIALVFFLSPEIRARYYIMQGNYNRAGKLYEHILAKHPEKTKVYVSLANVYLVNKRKDKMALKVYQTALKIEVDTAMKEKMVSIVAGEYLKRNIINQNSIHVLTQALQNEIKRLE